MKLSFLGIKSFVFGALALLSTFSSDLHSQSVGVFVANFTYPTAQQVEFDVIVQDIQAGSGTPEIKLGALGGGLQYSAAIGGTIATGNNTGFTVVSQPTANGFPGLNNFGPNINHTNTASVVRHIRWTHAVPGAGISAFVMLTAAPKILARFRLTSSTPWAVIPNASHFTLAPIASGYSSPQAVVEIGGNGLQTTLTLANGVALPVGLIDFTANAEGTSNQLKWFTSTERNTAWHVVERSKNGTSQWEEVGKLQGAGASTLTREYAFEDKQPFARSYYRLRFVDFDGSEERSKVLLVARKSGIMGVTGVYPSPSTDRVTVQFESLQEEATTIQVFDFNGRLVLQQEVAAQKGANQSVVELSSLQAGTYTINLLTADEVSAQVKVVKQ